MKRRVVVTGMGVITPIGSTVSEFCNSLVTGRSGVHTIDRFATSDYPAKIAATVDDFEPGVYIDRKEAKRMDRFAQFAVAAAKMAVEDAKLVVNEDNEDVVGVYIGSGIGGIGTFMEQHAVLLEKGPRRVSPYFIPMLIGDIASAHVSIMLGAKGPNSAPVSACATGTNAIGDAFKIIQRGDADVMISGGAEAAILPLSLAGFCSAKALSTRNDEPTRASRPFDRERDGFVMGEGAGIVVLESLDSAVARGANIYAEIVGYGMSGDAFHIVQPAPEGAGAARSMQAALKDAGLTPGDVDYINAHGTSTYFNDMLETQAIKKVFGDAAYRLSVSSTKSMTGHLLGAAGGIEAVVCVESIRNAIAPPTINQDYPDPECDLNYVPNTPQPRNISVALSNSFGFGGHNATIVFKAYKAVD